MCKNVDSRRSTPGNTVYVCPNAYSEAGLCKCGPNCERDPYTGICCSRIETINGVPFLYRRRKRSVTSDTSSSKYM